MSEQKITFDDYLQLTAVLFNWGDSYDAKDWPRLESILAPKLKCDYTTIGKPNYPSLTPQEFMDMVTHPEFLGDETVKTQHLLGASEWKRISDTEVVGYHQLRAGHQVYKTKELKDDEVIMKGHSHATNEHYYTKVDGVWKFAGLSPKVRWNEMDGPNNFYKVFKGSYKD